MKIVTIYQAKTHLSKLIQEALAGEEIIIAKGKNPVVKLTVVTKKMHVAPRRQRPNYGVHDSSRRRIGGRGFVRRQATALVV